MHVCFCMTGHSKPSNTLPDSEGDYVKSFYHEGDVSNQSLFPLLQIDQKLFKAKVFPALQMADAGVLQYQQMREGERDCL